MLEGANIGGDLTVINAPRESYGHICHRYRTIAHINAGFGERLVRPVRPINLRIVRIWLTTPRLTSKSTYRPLNVIVLISMCARALRSHAYPDGFATSRNLRHIEHRTAGSHPNHRTYGSPLSGCRSAYALAATCLKSQHVFRSWSLDLVLGAPIPGNLPPFACRSWTHHRDQFAPDVRHLSPVCHQLCNCTTHRGRRKDLTKPLRPHQLPNVLP